MDDLQPIRGLSLRRKALPALPRHASISAPASRWARALVGGWWAWEVIAALVSLAATVALVAMLAAADGRPQQIWTIGSTQLTLNTLVAAISTVMRSALMLAVAGALNQSSWNWFASSGAQQQGRPLRDLEIFGEAAANSWNSAKLLYRTRGRNLAALGALVAIFSVAFDAFVQQVLTVETYEQQTVLSGGNLSVQNVLPRRQIYDNEALAEGVNDISLDLQAVVLNSLLKDNTTLPGAVCPTGNCTWPTTPTLGVCSECTDASSQLVIGHTGSAPTYTLLWPDSFSPGGGGGPNSSFSSACSGESPTAQTCKIWNLDSAYWIAPSSDGARGRVTIANFYSYGVPPAAAIGSTSASDLSASAVAYNCSMYYCLQAFSASSASGQTTQRAAAAAADSTYREWDNATSQFVWRFEPTAQALNAPDASAYWLAELVFSSIGDQLVTVLVGSAALEGGSAAPTQPLPATALAKVFWESSSSLANVTALAAGLAAGLTTHLRTTWPAGLDALYAPTASAPVLLVGVRWAWLAYPLALLVGGLGFLALTAAATRGGRVHAWKGHRVPLLLAEIDPEVRAIAWGGLESRTGVDDRVGACRVRLEVDGLGGAGSIAFKRVVSEEEPLKGRRRSDRSLMGETP